MTLILLRLFECAAKNALLFYKLVYIAAMSMGFSIIEILDTFKSDPWTYTLCIAGPLALGLVGMKIWNAVGAKRRKSALPGTVVLYQFGRGPWAPSLTPFGIKLEAYLRMANIKYTICADLISSSKKKWPWIEYNGQDYADSEFIIEFLNKEFNVDLNSHLTQEQKGIGRALQKMMEEDFYWCMVADRWIFDQTKGVFRAFKLSIWRCWLIRYFLSKQLYAQGTGRHTEEEVVHIMRLDFESVSNVLGKKKFLFGDKISQYDLGVYGLLCQALYHGFGGHAPKVIKEFPNLCSYCESMKAAIWPDWDECNTAGGTWKALK